MDDSRDEAASSLEQAAADDVGDPEDEQGQDPSADSAASADETASSLEQTDRDDLGGPEDEQGQDPSADSAASADETASSLEQTDRDDLGGRVDEQGQDPSADSADAPDLAERRVVVVRAEPPWRFWLTLAVAALAAFGSLASWRVSTRVDGAVEELNEPSAQELIDTLRIGMTRDDIEDSLGTSPYITSEDAQLTQLLKMDIERSVYYLPKPQLAIVGYFEGEQMRLVSVTTLSDDVHVTLPITMGGSLKFSGFVTNATTFSELGCNQAAGGYGANFIYAAVGCGPGGVTSFWANVATNNWHGPLDADQLSPFIEEPTAEPDWDASLTFNGFAVIDPSIGMNLARQVGDAPKFGDLVSSAHFGPRIGELPIDVNE